MCCLTPESTARYLWKNTLGDVSMSPGSSRSGVEPLSTVEKITWITIRSHSAASQECSLDLGLQTTRKLG
eukprot:3941371-Rhodomonas_salina.1